jgi:hypothetical protein
MEKAVPCSGGIVDFMGKRSLVANEQQKEAKAWLSYDTGGCRNPPEQVAMAQSFQRFW